MNMFQVLKRIANTSVNTFPLAIMSIRPLFKEEICNGKAKSHTSRTTAGKGGQCYFSFFSRDWPTENLPPAKIVHKIFGSVILLIYVRKIEIVQTGEGVKRAAIIRWD
jgi:hypothetical protein